VKRPIKPAAGPNPETGEIRVGPYRLHLGARAALRDPLSLTRLGEAARHLGLDVVGLSLTTDDEVEE